MKRCFRHVRLILLLAASFTCAAPAGAQLLIGFDDNEQVAGTYTVADNITEEPTIVVASQEADESKERVPALRAYEAPDYVSLNEADKYRVENPEKNTSFSDGDNEPVDLSADSLQHDENGQTVTAIGNVELVQGKRILRADRIIYDLSEDSVLADGNIILSEPNGDVHFFDEVYLKDEMKNGFVLGLQSFLSDGGRFVAEEGQRENETLITMRNASYTPCECAENEDGDPAWQIVAEEVQYDEAAHKVSYKNARFEFFGVPVAWTPFLSHPDGQIKRKSGFLAPTGGFDSQLGVVVTENYYYDIAPNKDATVGVMLTSREVPVGLAQYRHRFEDAEIQLDGSATYSKRTDRIAGEDVRTDDELRGHLFAEGLWNIDEKWRAGIDLELTTDDQYLRQYDFTGKDVLENEIYVERFSGRNYTVARALAFQDVRVEEEQQDQPNVLPEAEFNFVGEPNAMLGGRWEVQGSALALQRDQGQDMTRLTGQVGWKTRGVTEFGLVNTLETSVRGDAYWVNDRDIATAGSGLSNDGTETRVFPRAHLVSSYPLVKPTEKMQIIVEPMAAATIGVNIDSDDGDIPNEDSQDVQLDASNLFEANRFPGRDRIEDRSHVTYGLHTGLYGYEGSYLDVFVGQSYRFQDEDNPFPNGSGLSQQKSDYVGQIAGDYDDRFGVNYRFQLDEQNFKSRRHEVDGYADLGRLDLSSRYLFAKALEGTDIDESREQLGVSAALNVTRNWRLRGGVLQDLGENPGLRKGTVGIDYFGCCMSFSVTAERNVTSDASGDSGTDVFFRLGLKGLGEFETAGSGGWRGNSYNTR